MAQEEKTMERKKIAEEKDKKDEKKKCQIWKILKE